MLENPRSPIGHNFSKIVSIFKKKNVVNFKIYGDFLNFPRIVYIFLYFQNLIDFLKGEENTKNAKNFENHSKF